MSRPLPRLGQEWGTCSTCGRGKPISYLILSRRFGWQCLDSEFGRGCYDGPVQRDELRYVPRSGEGTRRSASPQYDLGSSTWNYSATDQVRLFDFDTGTTYLAEFGDDSVTTTATTGYPKGAAGFLISNSPGEVAVLRSGSFAPISRNATRRAILTPPTDRYFTVSGGVVTYHGS